jgi:exoribonuclease-2
MNNIKFGKNSLVLYKRRPARVLQTGERIEIQPAGGDSIKVRPKDFKLLHPGPVPDLTQLSPIEGDADLAWQILLEAGGEHTLTELATLIYGEFSPRSAWAAWQLVEDGLYFYGEPEAILIRTEEEVDKELQIRKSKLEEANLWSEFIVRLQNGQIDQENDARFFREVEDLAYGRRTESRVLRELGRTENPESAHALLLQCRVWDDSINPYPVRVNISISPTDNAIVELSDEPRLDLTNLEAFAIDDRENKDPDDAISLISCDFDSQGKMVNGRLWVHIADPAAVIPSGSILDETARSRGATLYLPEGARPMLPEKAIDLLALGLEEVNSAISFELELDDAAIPHLKRIAPSKLRVRRLSYEEVERKLEIEPFASLLRISQSYERRRREQGALSIDLPENIIHVHDGNVQIRPLVRLSSRELVREAMLITGEAVAQFAVENEIPFLFAVQDPAIFPESLPQKLQPPQGLQTISGRFAIRRFLKRSILSVHPGQHAGLGLPHYSRCTSPLRRYADLLCHQQLNQFIHGQKLLDPQTLLERMSEAEEASIRISQAESLSRRHWTLVYLKQNPDWQGEAILVEKIGLKGLVILPELAYETSVYLRADLPLDSVMRVRVDWINLPELEAHFLVD